VKAIEILSYILFSLPLAAGLHLLFNKVPRSVAALRTAKAYLIIILSNVVYAILIFTPIFNFHLECAQESVTNSLCSNKIAMIAAESAGFVSFILLGVFLPIALCFYIVRKKI